MNSDVRRGKILESYYNNTILGKLYILDINTNKKFYASYIMNDKIFIKNDLVDFEFNENNKIVNLVFKDAGLDCDEIYPKPLENIKNTNYKLTLLQLRKTHIKDDKGYSNEKISKGLTIEQMWNNDAFVKEHYNLLLQCTVSLLCDHLQQAEITVNTDSFHLVIPFYEQINSIEKMHLVQKRFEILNKNFSLFKEEEYNFRFLKIDNKDKDKRTLPPSLIVFSPKKDNIIEIIKTYNLSCLTENKTENHPIFQEKTIYQKPMYILDIHPNLLIYNQPLGKFFLDETDSSLSMKQYFKEKEFADLKNYVEYMTPTLQKNIKAKGP